MALYDKVRENLQKMQSGQLGSTSDEELQKQATDAGRMAPPVTPLEGAVLGANPDAAKMAGTPNNKLNALQQSFRQETDKLQTTLRQQQARTEATAAEAATKEKAKQLEANLAGAPERLQQVARAAFTKTNTPAAQLTLNNDKFSATLPATFDKTKLAETQALAQKAVSGEISVDELVQLETAIGGEITAEKIKQWYPDLSTTTADSIAQALPNNITAGQIYQTPEALQAAAASLGMTPDALEGMTFKQLKEKTAAVQAEQFSKTERLRRSAVDPNMSAAERAQARSALRDQGAIGLSSTERDVASLEERIANGDQVSFNGKLVDIEELLSDDFVKGEVMTALSSPAALEALRKTEPDLAAMIDKNKAALEAQMAKENPQLQQYAEINKYNKNIGKGSGASSETLAKMIPGFGKPSATKLKVPPSVEGILALPDDDTDKAKFIASMEQFAKHPELAADFQKLSVQQLYDLGLNNQDNVTRALTAYQDSKALETIDPSTVTTGQLDGILGTNLEKLKKDLPALWSQAAISDPDSQLNRFLAIVDSNRDGVMDSNAAIATAAKSVLGTVSSIVQARNAGIGVNDPKIEPSPMATSFAGVFQDGNVNEEEKKTLGETRGVKELESLDSATGGKYGLASAIDKASDREATTAVTSSVGAGWTKAVENFGEYGPGEHKNREAAKLAFDTILQDPNIPESTKIKVRKQKVKAEAAISAYESSVGNAVSEMNALRTEADNMGVADDEDAGWRNRFRDIAAELEWLKDNAQQKDIKARRDALIAEKNQINSARASKAKKGWFNDIK